MSFDAAYDFTVGLEGGYSNDPADAGGQTMFGITERVARANGYKGEMRYLPKETAKFIYKKDYWNPLKLDEICILSPDIAHEMFDTAVNCGVGVPARFLQRSLNLLTPKPDLKVDGQIGPTTIRFLSDFLKIRGNNGIRCLLKMLNGQQVTYYMEITENRPANRQFIYGWVMNRA